MEKHDQKILICPCDKKPCFRQDWKTPGCEAFKTYEWEPVFFACWRFKPGALQKKVEIPVAAEAPEDPWLNEPGWGKEYES
jgi:hypothetical protein